MKETTLIVNFLNQCEYRYEGLFYICLCVLMFCWLEMETQQSMSTNPVNKVRF